MQRKLICPTPDTAKRLVDKLAKHRSGREFTVYGVTFGHQVVEIRKFSGFGYSWDGKRWVKYHRPMPKKGVAAPSLLPAGQVLTTTVKLPLLEETKAYLGANVGGKLAWFGKSTLISHEVAGAVVTMELPIKIAQKRGLVAA